ncbi:MAG: GC-type dockerin domain-anchored protein [Phycisphaerales bacterium]|jgi:hypothetical protein
MNRFASTIIAAMTLCAGSTVALAQVNEGDMRPATLTKSAALPGIDALGDTIGCPTDLDTLTGDNGNLGVEFAFGYYWITHNGDFATGTQVLVQADTDFNIVETYIQLTNSPQWGHRDGASIESENLLFFGAEGGEVTQYVFDPSTQRLDLTASQILQFDTTNTIRALAWDPNLEQFYSKDFSDPVEIYDRSGFLLNFGDSDVSAYGAAYDPTTETVWFHGYRAGLGGGADAPKTRIAEWDPATGTSTGQTVDTDPAGDVAWVGYLAGGMDIRVDGSDVIAICLGQGDPFDYIQEFAINGDGSPCGGGCRVDIDGDGALTIFDFLGFQNLFDAGDLQADFDGDGALTIFDFLTFQNEFDAGC